MKSAFLFLSGLLLFCLLAGGGYAAYEAHRFLNTPASQTPEDVIIAIAPGATFDRVAWDLKKAGAITDVTRFRLLAQLKDALGKVKAGEFLVNTGWTPERVLAQITQGRAVLYRLTLREGLTWWETARAVEAQGFATYDDFKAVIHDPAFLQEHNIPFANAEGFLFPETYLMKKPRNPPDREQARETAAAMVRMFWVKTEPLWKALPKKGQGGQGGGAAATGAMQSPPPVRNESPAGSERSAPSGMAAPTAPESANAALPEPLPEAPPGAEAQQENPPATRQAAGEQNSGTGRPAGNTAFAPAPHPDGGPQSPADVDPEALRQVIILASLVEKETGVPSERGPVAGVYANRLRLGMLLQCDPTIIYGVGEGFTGAIRRSQLDDAGNPYNTYRHPGLPPGPICSSGLEALKAAFAPPQHDYLYFVATGIDGGHTFSKTLSEHNKAVQVYRSRMRERK